MGRILKKRCSTIQGGNSNFPIDLPINTGKKNQKCIYTVQKLEGLKNIETFNLQPATDDVSDL